MCSVQYLGCKCPQNFALQNQDGSAAGEPDFDLKKICYLKIKTKCGYTILLGKDSRDGYGRDWVGFIDNFDKFRKVKKSV